MVGTPSTASNPVVLVEPRGEHTWITLANPSRRNALSAQMLTELDTAFRATALTAATGVVLAAQGTVFSAGHDLADVHRRDKSGVEELLVQCTQLMSTIQSMPQVVLARVQGLATAAGCQLVASCDLAVAAQSAGFALPGGRGGWFCHTPAVPVARSIGRKRLMEMALTGDIVGAEQAADWGLINYAVADNALDTAVADLLSRATRGSAASKAAGKTTLYAQLDRPESEAYPIAVTTMLTTAHTADAVEGRRAFLAKRSPQWR